MTPQQRLPIDTILAKSKLLSRLLNAHQSIFNDISFLAGDHPFSETGTDGRLSSSLAMKVDQASNQIDAILCQLMSDIVAWQPEPSRLQTTRSAFEYDSETYA